MILEGDWAMESTTGLINESKERAEQLPNSRRNREVKNEWRLALSEQMQGMVQ